MSRNWIGTGDLKQLLLYMTIKLVLLNGVPATKAVSFTGVESDAERLQYIEKYKNEQREILAELIADSKVMLMSTTASSQPRLHRARTTDDQCILPLKTSTVMAHRQNHMLRSSRDCTAPCHQRTHYGAMPTRFRMARFVGFLAIPLIVGCGASTRSSVGEEEDGPFVVGF